MRLGVDFAGTVEAVGKDVTDFKVGDEVFGARDGALAQYVCPRASRAIVHKPANISFEEAASVPVAAVTALQGLRDQGHIQAGQSVLINGASGGVGTFAVQLAKVLGAEVTGVCSTRNLELVRSLGADHVVDYTKEDFTKSGQHYDVILDNVGTQPLTSFRSALKPKGICVLIGGGGPNDGTWVGPMTRPVKAMLLSPFISQRFVMFLAQLKKDDLNLLSNLMKSGKVRPVVDRTFKLNEVAEAMRYLEKGHARGKVIVEVE
jgi:NADPH:quinone reductase-like Zn-dependent oxidoreductase